MRKLQRFCASLSLTIALSITALAGDIHTGKPLSLPDQPPTVSGPLVSGTTHGGFPSTVADVNGASSTDPLTDLAFALLGGVLFNF